MEFDQVANIKVFGIGGGCCNYGNRMERERLRGCTFFDLKKEIYAL